MVVYAASSLRGGLESLADRVASVDPCAPEVVVEYGSSGSLAAAIANGAPVDVFVSAGSAAMQTVLDARVDAGEPADLVASEASLMVSRVSERRDEILAIEDLLADGVVTGLCVSTAPCGALADEVMAKAGKLGGRTLERASVADTEAASSADLVTKIALGEIDAGIVLSSECVLARADALCRELPARISASTVYGVVALRDTAPVRTVVAALRDDEMIDRLVADHGFARITG